MSVQAIFFFLLRATASFGFFWAFAHFVSVDGTNLLICLHDQQGAGGCCSLLYCNYEQQFWDRDYMSKTYAEPLHVLS